MTVTDMLETELQTYEAHKAKLLADHEGEFVLIRGDEVAGTFKNQQDAIDAGYREWGNVPFLVKQIVAFELPINFISPFVAV